MNAPLRIGYRTVGRSLAATVMGSGLWLAALAGPAKAQEAACASPSNTCGRSVQSGCLQTLGAGAVAVDDATRRACEGSLTGYRQCLVLVVQQCQSSETPKAEDKAAAPPDACPREIETRLWDAVKDSGDPDLVRHFLTTCAESVLAMVARARLVSLEEQIEAVLAPVGAAPAAPARAAPAGAEPCPRNFTGKSGALQCVCPAGAYGGSVWGSGPYTADSAICKAALHAGVVGQEGGAVSLVAAPGQSAYAGTNQNGVDTSSWGAYQASFLFPDAPSAAEIAASPGAPCPSHFKGRSGTLRCTCPAGGGRGAVWGTGLYTADSSICKAALHAGVIDASGGEVSLRAEGGLSSYTGTLNNGVQTSGWGAYAASFTFEDLPEAELAALRAICPANARHLRESGAALSCDCPPGAVAGSVWGDGVYTDDSSICRAAVHAGRISAAGGAVMLEILPGRQSYEGSARNGVSSSSYGAWGGSYRFSGG